MGHSVWLLQQDVGSCPSPVDLLNHHWVLVEECSSALTHIRERLQSDVWTRVDQCGPVWTHVNGDAKKKLLCFQEKRCPVKQGLQLGGGTAVAWRRSALSKCFFPSSINPWSESLQQAQG